jgi:hypothetical protein
MTEGILLLEDVSLKTQANKRRIQKVMKMAVVTLAI